MILFFGKYLYMVLCVILIIQFLKVDNFLIELEKLIIPLYLLMIQLKITKIRYQEILTMVLLLYQSLLNHLFYYLKMKKILIIKIFRGRLLYMKMKRAR